VVRTWTDDAGPRSAVPRQAEFERVYAAHYDALIRLALLTTGSAAVAEDVVQEAYVALYQRWFDVVEPGAWLRRVVTNRSTSWLRRLMVMRRHDRRLDPVTTHAAPAAEDIAVRTALARLRPRQRAAVFLRFYLDLSEAEIAEALGCRPGTVKSLLHRALAVLKEHLDEH
jgi:RNA polymerase sigma-70 factor (sigma-E family)